MYGLCLNINERDLDLREPHMVKYADSRLTSSLTWAPTSPSPNIDTINYPISLLGPNHIPNLPLAVECDPTFHNLNTDPYSSKPQTSHPHLQNVLLHPQHTIPPQTILHTRQQRKRIIQHRPDNIDPKPPTPRRRRLLCRNRSRPLPHTLPFPLFPINHHFLRATSLRRPIQTQRQHLHLLPAYACTSSGPFPSQ